MSVASDETVPSARRTTSTWVVWRVDAGLFVTSVELLRRQISREHRGGVDASRRVSALDRR